MTAITYAAAIDTAEQAFRRAKRAAESARAASKASPADLELRAAASAASDVASDAGRVLAGWQFEEALDLWVDRAAANAAVVLDTLVEVAPRDSRGEVDWYWLAAAHLARAGVTVPGSWRSPVTREPLHAYSHHGQPED
jgi:hypothetical protein